MTSEIATGLGLLAGGFLVVAGAGKLLELRGETEARRGENQPAHSLLDEVVPSWFPSTLASVLLLAFELTLGLAILLGIVYPWAEIATTVFFVIVAAVAAWGLEHAPEADCGCMGALGQGQVSLQSVARASLLAAMVAADAAVGSAAGLATLDSSWVTAAAVFIGGAALLCLSPELPRSLVGDQFQRLRVAMCRRSVLPQQAAVARLRSSDLWDRWGPIVSGDEPLDDWSDGCWRFVCFPARYNGRDVTAVFNLYRGRVSRWNSVTLIDERHGTIVAPMDAAAL